MRTPLWSRSLPPDATGLQLVAAQDAVIACWRAGDTVHVERIDADGRTLARNQFRAPYSHGLPIELIASPDQSVLGVAGVLGQSTTVVAILDAVSLQEQESPDASGVCHACLFDVNTLLFTDHRHGRLTRLVRPHRFHVRDAAEKVWAGRMIRLGDRLIHAIYENDGVEAREPGASARFARMETHTSVTALLPVGDAAFIAGYEGVVWVWRPPEPPVMHRLDHPVVALARVGNGVLAFDEVSDATFVTESSVGDKVALGVDRIDAAAGLPGWFVAGYGGCFGAWST